MGYSDTTSNHFMCLHAGLSSFYGPSIMAGFGENGGLHETLKNSIQWISDTRIRCLYFRTGQRPK